MVTAIQLKSFCNRKLKNRAHRAPGSKSNTRSPLFKEYEHFKQCYWCCWASVTTAHFLIDDVSAERGLQSILRRCWQEALVQRSNWLAVDLVQLRIRGLPCCGDNTGNVDLHSLPAEKCHAVGVVHLQFRVFVDWLLLLRDRFVRHQLDVASMRAVLTTDRTVVWRFWRWNTGQRSRLWSERECNSTDASSARDVWVLLVFHISFDRLCLAWCLSHACSQVSLPQDHNFHWVDIDDIVTTRCWVV